MVWLGSEAENSSSVLRTLNKIGSMVGVNWFDYTMKSSDEARAAGELDWADRNADMRHMRHMPFKSGELNRVHRLLERMPFEHLWIRQEISLATNAVLMCGFESVP